MIGDIGEAVFEWSEDLTLDFLASLNFDYFLGKCQASPAGKEFEQWDGRVAASNCAHRIKEIEAQNLEGNEDPATAHELELLSGLGVDSDKDEYNCAAKDYYDETGDAEGASSISDMGVVPSVHAIGMFVGLQMAIAQLKVAK